MNLFNKIKNGFSYVKTYWKTPPLGNYMSVKEIAALAGGGMGIRFITQCVASVLLSATNVFVGNTIGIEPMNLYYIYLIAVIVSFPLTMFRAYIVDNTRNKKGKYRPYLISMGIPTVILSIGYFWMPYEKMESQLTKCIVVLLFNIGFQFFYNFLYEAYYNYVVVLSPNTQERANVSSVKAVVESFGPSVTGIIIPLFAKNFIGTGNLNDIRIYRYIWVPILIVGLLLSIIVYANTREQIIQAKTHVVQIKFTDAIREVAKNKYFWIISLAGWLGFLEGACFNILNWLYSYQHACTAGQYALITTVYGNASLWGMLLAPLAIKKIGKGKTLILINSLNIFFIGAIYPIVRYADISIMIWLVLICLWMNALVGAFGHILTPSINGDIRDYQQYVSGERIDGMFAAVGLIGSVVTMATSSVLPAIYEKVGFNEETLQKLLPSIIAQEGPLADPTNVYNVLYHKETFIAIFGVLVGASVIGAAMNVIPYLFYDLTEVRQQGIIKVLKIRALFEDYGNGVLGGTSNYESPIAAVEKLGGLTVINHPGEYTNARDEDEQENAYNLDDPVYNYKITKFAKLLSEYNTCLGIDINSKGDSRTRYDRKLWDILLQKLVPHGRNVYAIATTDAHNLGIVDSGYTVMLMNDLNSADLKKAMENGQFFAASKYIGNINEMNDYKAIAQNIDTTEAKLFVQMIDTALANGDKFYAGEDAIGPKVTNITVNDTEDTISLATDNAVVIRWIADGKQIHVGNEIDLDDYSDKIGSYVRAEIVGVGGVLYTQAFTLDYEGAPEAEEFGSFFDFGGIVSAICDTIVKLLPYILPLKLIYFIAGV